MQTYGSRKLVPQVFVLRVHSLKISEFVICSKANISQQVLLI